jgi:hypothetical protein
MLDVIAQRRAAGADRLVQHRPDRCDERIHSRATHPPGGERRPDAGTKQRLARVDVADTGHNPRIHDECLDGRAAAACALPQRCTGEFLRERLGCEAREQPVARGLASREQDAAEPARVVEPEATPGVEHEIEVVVHERRRGRVEDAEASRHAEVQDQGAGVGFDQQVLRAPADAADARSREFRRERPRHAPAQAPLAYLERVDAPADEPGLDAPARRFYLG